jgi:hypothetical protein
MTMTKLRLKFQNCSGMFEFQNSRTFPDSRIREPSGTFFCVLFLMSYWLVLLWFIVGCLNFFFFLVLFTRQGLHTSQTVFTLHSLLFTFPLRGLRRFLLGGGSVTAGQSLVDFRFCFSLLCRVIASFMERGLSFGCQSLRHSRRTQFIHRSRAPPPCPRFPVPSVPLVCDCSLRSISTVPSHSTPWTQHKHMNKVVP